jgi:hypothetical protein
LRNILGIYEHPIAISLLLGGVLWNVIARRCRGFAIEFVDLALQIQCWLTFNVADPALCVAMCILIFSRPRICKPKNMDIKGLGRNKIMILFESEELKQRYYFCIATAKGFTSQAILWFADCRNFENTFSKMNSKSAIWASSWKVLPQMQYVHRNIEFPLNMNWSFTSCLINYSSAVRKQR